VSAEPSRVSAEGETPQVNVMNGHPGWFAFDPAPDAFSAAAVDLRFLNETFAGEHGQIGAKDGQFIHTLTGEPVLFWAVNGPPSQASDPESLRRLARMLAKRGVNLVRVHTPVFDRDGAVEIAKIRRAHAIVDAMKAEGIYTHFSIYFPLWFTPRPDHPWLPGYTGSQHPFAALFFNERFQAEYRAWWKALLQTPSETTGQPLTQEPAVFGVEIQNEDSFFFWTFNPDNIPAVQLEVLETRFADWLRRRYGSVETALSTWNGPRMKRDDPAAGRAAFRPLWNMFNEKTARDQDTARFLFEVQEQFYRQTYAHLRALGFRGLITASNWHTASPEIFGPLEKLSYTTGDFIDRHGYFGCAHRGDNAAWSIRNGHTYTDRSALRFDAEDPAKPKQFVHPVMDPQYDDKPSMISETTFTRPNRFRSEAPLYYAVYGALQESDAIVHFALDSTHWSVKPGFWMQPWTLMSPAMMGQSPAAALIYRRGLVAPGRVLADVTLNRQDLFQLQGTPLPQDASFDELRLPQVPADARVTPGQRLDPLVFYAGRTVVRFSDKAGQVRLDNLGPYLRRDEQRVVSSTGQVQLDYRHGVLKINAPQAQGISGALHGAGTVELQDFIFESELELGHIVAVSLDSQPLPRSERILLQVMSEERATDFATEPAGDREQRIVNIGTDPWQVKELVGTVRFKRRDADALRVVALDHNGYPLETLGNAREVRLQPQTLYYLIRR